MDFSFGNLVKSVVGAVAKVANAVVNTVKSAISGISGMVSSAAETIGSALSGAMAALGVVDVDEDGELDIDDAEEFLEEKFKLLVGAFMQGVKNLESHSKDTLLATGGFVFGGIGLVGSGIGEFFSGGTASPLAIPVATFSANSVVSSVADLKAIFSGNYEQKGKFNPLKSGAELTGATIGEGIDKVVDFTGHNSNIEDAGKNVGGWMFEAGDFYFGAKGVSGGVKKIADTSYKFKEVTSIGNTIIPTISIPVNNVSKTEKIGASMDISNTVAGWVDKVVGNDDDKK
ncbi:hypothetical protein ACTFIN_05860 [Clostridium cagae]|uniref:hypothetical protein n=1 Tax=Clostridium TaxID=1485 RepID=UPI00207A1E41|nr:MULTISPECIES: hypothetical protein [unclassified Clostridium]